MLNKKFFWVFAFFMLVAVSLNFGSAYVSLNPWNAILGGNINSSISDSSFSPFVYFYDYSGHFLETVNLGCGGVSGYCSGPQTFSVPLSSSIFPLGVYRFDIYSYSQNSWISTYFDVSSYSSYTKTCSDGTVAGTCSSTKPLDCLGSSLDSGALGFVNNCQLCGCDSGYVCQSDGSCALSSQAPAPVTSGGLSVANSVSVNVGNSVTVPISGGSGVYGLASHPNTAYAYVSVSGSHVTITGVAAGTTDVVITDSNSNTATISITVMPPSISTCTDSDNGSIYVQGIVTTLSGSYTDTCFPDGTTLSDGYCYGPNSIGIKNVVCPAGCVNGACVQSSSSAASPSSANSNTAPPIPPVGPNEKYFALYSPKETFLVSDANWRDVLPMVSATTWTDSNGNVQKYPLLIYHEENQSITTHYQNAFSSNAQGYPSNVVYAYSIDGNNIAYITNGDIYLFNTQTLQDTLIATPPSLDDFWTSIRTVSVSGDNIVWIEQDSSNKTGTDITPVPYVYKIYSYNLKNQAQTLLSSFNVDPSSGTANSFIPDISISGNYVMWNTWLGLSMKYDVYLYNLATGVQTKISADSSTYGIQTSGDYVLLQVDTRTGTNTYLYDLRSQQTNKILSISSSMGCYPSAYLSGESVIFTRNNFGRNEINLYNISTGQTTTLFSTPPQIGCLKSPVLSGNNLFWIYSTGSNNVIYSWKDFSAPISRQLVGGTTTGPQAITNTTDYSQNSLAVANGNVYILDNNLQVYNSSASNVQTTIAFDADSPLYFLYQYSPDNLTIIGDSPSVLDSQLVSPYNSPDSGWNGAGLSISQIQRIHTDDYMNYWKSFNSVVYVEDDYNLALLASTYASLINAPLIIKGSSLDTSEIFAGRSVICVGNVNPTGSSCSETYSLDQLQQKYLSATGTDKAILVNPNDYKYIFSTDVVQGILGGSYYYTGSGNTIFNSYQKISLSAPILASAKHELILSTTETDPYQIQDYLKQHLSGMNYLTIMAAQSMIPIRSGSAPEPPLDSTFTSQLVYALSSELDFTPSLDPSVYADVNGDHKPDVAVGRIAGLGTADVSGYIARDLFYNQISTDSKNKVLLMGSSFYGTLANLVMNIGTYFKDAGYQNTTLASSESEYSFDSSNLIGQGLIFYADHGDSFIIGGIHSEEIPLLDNSLFDVAACDTVSSQTANSFWSWTIRKGSVGYLGAVSTTFLDTDAVDFLSNVYYDNSSLGVAFKNSYKFDWFNEMTTLIGDPTFNIQPPHKLNQKIQITLSSIFSSVCTPQGNFCGFGQVLWHCCPGNTCQWFTCKACLPAGTTVNLFTQGNCCGSWTWTTKQNPNFCGWCANGAKLCWPWDWRMGWDAAHCGTSTVNDHKVCT